MAVETKLTADVSREGSIAIQMSRLLADTYATYQKTLFYHWNVTGPRFPSLHQMFEDEYVELQDAIDLIAERVRQLGATTPPFGQPMAMLSSIDPDEGVPRAEDMVRGLIAANEAVALTARDVVTVAEERGDVASADIATERIEAHEKAIWMLRATAD